ncbi:MAG: histidinol-phosphate transaminase [Betaproteobacteria bacterium RBG_16_64_9]|nr:MAG: histidinol-phosphate transaminase [Betaproteobacteria bacterium RBG_16_64_9]
MKPRIGPDSVVRADIRALSAYHVQDAAGLVKLDAMENPYSLPEWLCADIGRAVQRAPLNRYPDPDAPALKARLRRVMGIPEELGLLLGNGSDEIISMVVNAVSAPGAAVLAPTPSFVMYSMSAIIAKARWVGVPIEPDFSLSADKMLAAMREHRPAAIFISYPNNPTGNLFDEKTLETIIQEAPGLVVIDEAYQPFAGRTFMTRLQDFANLLVLRTVSKLGLAGLRLGYAVARPEWIGELDKVRGPYNVGVLTQVVADKVLEHPEVLDAQAAAIRTERERLYTELSAMKGVQVFPSAANFLLLRVPDAQKMFEGLKKRGVLVKSLHGATRLLDQCLRITIGTPEENRLLMRAFGEALSEL